MDTTRRILRAIYLAKFQYGYVVRKMSLYSSEFKFPSLKQPKWVVRSHNTVAGGGACAPRCHAVAL